MISKALINAERSSRLQLQAAFLASILISLPSFAQSPLATGCDLADYESSLRPDPQGSPTHVTIGLTLADITAIRDVDQTIAVDALLTLRWTDHRLDRAVGCRYPYASIWTPDVQLINSAALQSRQPPQILVEADGSVIATVRYNADIVSSANIADFPFDERTILVQLGSLRYDTSELRYRISDTWAGRRQEMTIPDWTIGEPTAAVRELELPRVARTLPIFEFRIPASRLADYYVYKFVFPLCLIVMMSWSVFWIDARNLAPQLSLAATSMLTLIAYQFTVNDLLPRVGYLTSMDQYVLSSSLLVFLALVEALFSSRLASTGRAAIAERLDQTSRWLFPSIYVAMIVVTLVL